MTADLDQILSEFMDAWTSGRRPDVDEHLARVPESQRDELAGLIHSFLTVAPTPDYDDRAFDELRSEPLVRDIVAVELPSLLTRLRRRADLTVRQLAESLTPDLGVRGQEDKTAGYLDRLEQGDLDPRGVSRRVLDAAAKVLGVASADLVAAANVARGPTPSPMLFRAPADVGEDVEQHLEVLADLVVSPAPQGRQWDEVDELFLGGG